MARLALALALLVGCRIHSSVVAGDDIASACHGLGLGDCRTTTGCVPDTCDGCICAITYRGCLDASETPAQCPQLGCPSGACCSSAEQCAGSSGTCTPPGSSNGCGACNTTPRDCTTDIDCHGAHQICEPITCSCQGLSACVTGCVDDTTCTEGERCDLASARCVARACGASAPCPGNFACTNGACVRATCTDDLACDGYCVDGACYTQRGECRQPVP